MRREADRIIAVTLDRERAHLYRIELADFPRPDVLGLSIGGRRVYVSHSLAQLAFDNPRHLWLLRQTLAHEIAHEISGHAEESGSAQVHRSSSVGGVTAADLGLPPVVRFRHYSLDEELEADSRGLDYWKALGWDCRIWIEILRRFGEQDYAGDAFHPTGRRLARARAACPEDSGDSKEQHPAAPDAAAGNPDR
ncbi:MAG TPA: hypothetical protein VNN77_08500 [candidate division Zixibacteria bacterium]|nr:hypothetical protein [candidate division Zixibacteria bacterium]